MTCLPRIVHLQLLSRSVSTIRSSSLIPTLSLAHPTLTHHSQPSINPYYHPNGPKKSTTAAKPKAAGATSAHATYQDMIKDAILNLKERNGSSRQAIKKYIRANNTLPPTTDAAYASHINRALASGEEQGVFERPKGPSGPVKLLKKAAKPAVAKTDAKPTAKKAAAKPAKKAATKPAAKKAAPAKKAAAKPKANASKPRKTAAPAVDSKPAVVLGKTKSGRVTKTKTAATKKAPAKKPAAKKAAPKKSTPKKAEASA